MKAKSNIVSTKDLNELLFKVEKIPTIELTGIESNSEYNNTVVGLIGGTKKHLNFCSDRYALVPVETFAPQIRRIILAKGLNFTEHYTMVNNSVFYGEIIIEDKNYFIGSQNDPLKMRIHWSHSYNGLEQYDLNMGTFYRVLCSNGLWINKLDTTTYGLALTGRHTEKINESLHSLEIKLEDVLTNNVMGRMAEMFQPMYKNWFSNWNDVLIDVMKIAEIGTTKNNIAAITNIIANESKELAERGDNSYKGGKVNSWLIYNGINSFIFNYDNNIALESKRRLIDQKVLKALLK